MPRVEMSPSVQKLILSLIACLVPAMAGCVMRPSVLTWEESEAHAIATRQDIYDAAQAAARTEIADRRIAVELLRDLANRYRIAGREKTLAALDALLMPEVLQVEVASASLQAAPKATARRVASTRRSEAETHAALRDSFDVHSAFGALVHRCIDAIAASADKPTYNPKLFDWLCRASILPDAVEGLDSETVGDTSRWTRQAGSIHRLVRFATTCAVSGDPSCGDSGRLIAQLINQQPVVPVPQYLNKISVDRTSATAPTAAADAPATIQTN
jgi:hypothetical protein